MSINRIPSSLNTTRTTNLKNEENKKNDKLNMKYKQMPFDEVIFTKTSSAFSSKNPIEKFFERLFDCFKAPDEKTDLLKSLENINSQVCYRIEPLAKMRIESALSGVDLTDPYAIEDALKLFFRFYII